MKKRFRDNFLTKVNPMEDEYGADISQESGIPDFDERNEDAVVPEVLGDELIENTYQDNELSDLARSIFIVEKFMNTLPKELPNDIKKTTVIGILQASDITVNEVCTDASMRIEVLESVKVKLTDENSRTVSECSGKIEQLKSEIDALNNKIYSANNEAAHASDLISKEIARISNLEKFIHMDGGK